MSFIPKRLKKSGPGALYVCIDIKQNAEIMTKLKKVLINWSIIYVLITALIYVLNQWLIAYPIYIRTLVLSGIMVFTMQYVVSPFMKK